MSKIIATPIWLFFLFTISVTNLCFAQKGKIFIVQGDTVNIFKDTTVRNKLVGLNLNGFRGRTVRELLQNDTIKLYKQYWWNDEPPGKLRSLNLTYARGLYLSVFVYKLKYQPSFSESNHFSFEQFLKEEVSAVELDRNFFEENVVKKYSQ